MRGLLEINHRAMIFNELDVCHHVGCKTCAAEDVESEVRVINASKYLQYDFASFGLRVECYLDVLESIHW
jgi:hypothetical protein